jgi:hypothetical protein
MKTLVLLLVSAPLYAQWAGPLLTQWLDADGNAEESGNVKVIYQFSYSAGVKTLSFSVYSCDLSPFVVWATGNLKHPTENEPLCRIVTEGEADQFNFVWGLIVDLKNWANGAPNKIKYGKLLKRLGFSLGTVPPSAPPAPSMVLVDGLAGDVIELDLTTNTVVKRVTPPLSAIGPLAIRPSADPASKEVWVANQTRQVTIVDLAAQTVLANVATPSIPSVFNAVGMAFSNSGAAAFEAVKYASPDASGNNGALLVFDAVQRAVTYTFPLKYTPAVMVMAPDGLTIYLLSQAGEITYYDVLSGTADLNASTYAPGSNAGYNGFGNVFIHPDGTRLFWNVGTYLEVFDLTTRKVTAQFPSGLPSTSGVTLEVSQNGSVATMSNGQGTVVLLDTRTGILQGTISNPSTTLAFPGN